MKGNNWPVKLRVPSGATAIQSTGGRYSGGGGGADDGVDEDDDDDVVNDDDEDDGVLSGPSPCPHAVSPSPGPFAKSRPSPCPHADDYSPTVMSFTDCVDVEESGFEHGREESEDAGGYANSR